MTQAEAPLWSQLRREALPCRYRRQDPIGPYIVDFVCRRHRLIIELDGSQHLDSKYDEARSRWLEAAGFRVIRFWNIAVLGDLEMVIGTITSLCPLGPCPPERSEGGRGPHGVG